MAASCRYITQNSRISFKDETTFGLLSPNDLLAGAAGAGSQPAPEFSFICEVRQYERAGSHHDALSIATDLASGVMDVKMKGTMPISTSCD